MPGGTGVIRSNSFNPVGGSAESLALAAAATLVLVTALYSYNVKGAKKAFLLNIKYYILFGLSFATLLMVNNSLAWIALAIGLGAIFSFALYIIYVNRENKDSSIEIAIAPALTFFIFSILFLFLFAGGQGLNLPRLFFKSGLPQEVVLSASRGKSIVWESFKDNPLFGSGPGTFAYDFSQYRPASFNSSQFWQLRFDKAPMHFLELAATVGLLGVLSYLAFIGIFLFISFVFLRNMFRTSSEESYLAFAFSFAAFTLFIIQALYLTNTALMFFFWLALVMAMANWRLAFSKIFAVREIDLKKHQDLKPLFVSFTIVAAGFCLFFFYVQAKYYIADAAYNDFRLSGNRDRLVAAAKLNPRRLNYRIALAKDYINAVKDDVNLLSVPGGGESLTPEKREKLQLNIQQAIKEGEAAISLAPNSVIAWEALGAIYRDVRLIAAGSIDPAIRYFKKASELEPSNPILLTELGKLYLANNQTNEAAAAFSKATEQKDNYFEAYVGLAKTYDALGQADKALVILEDVIRRQPNPEVVYESGRLYYNQNKIDKAIERFNQAIQMYPEYANAIYSLGLAYQKKGDKINALEQFNQVLKLNPENEGVKAVIEELVGENKAEEAEENE
ncbi:hypothetical protein COT99_04080 [Candidatus Falkowbacteria bacterium CG10_big_fil_rev_8_21_14_0_10_43_10]|uniref:Uncharacterized protein n=1 Tax=Candidatus Falkowbacteria bacterium CG10_big_fil_rev_8_21_14_0_10_43_10 TaxID=1974567 RepID=A0A2H0V3D5_9BACT|nr:MAG: hypothetical protein COT99_04080 [Candidatus Falkowbacteria bacterium CG10_big_fil_rev_8_21_14_0_10_43_10]